MGTGFVALIASKVIRPSFLEYVIMLIPSLTEDFNTLSWQVLKIPSMYIITKDWQIPSQAVANILFNITHSMCNHRVIINFMY